MIKNNKGVTLVALSITIIVILIIASVTYVSGRDLLDSTKLKGYITTMYLIKGEVENINETYQFDGDTSNLKGKKLDISYTNPDTGISTKDMLKDIYTKEIFVGESDAEIKAGNEIAGGIWYILEQDDMKELGIENDMLNSGDVFIVNYSTGLIIYSKGYTNKGVTTYSLDGLLNIK